MKDILISRILKKIAPKIGAEVVVEPKWGCVGQINFKSGRRRYFRYSTLDLNRMGASDIARDKDYAKFFMKRLGYPVIEGKAFCSRAWAKAIKYRVSLEHAYNYAQKIGWPVIIKPNSSSQGRGVSKVSSRKEFEDAWKRVEKVDRMILLEQFIEGEDYRVVVLDDKVISAYQRIPLSVIGDGKSSILQLLKKKQNVFRKVGRDTLIKFDDPRIVTKLKRLKLTFSSIPRHNERIFLLDNANLSGGGDSVDVTDLISGGFKKLAIQITKDMGLRLCGVDLMTKTPISGDPVKGNHWIIEINSAPGLDHYASIGNKQKKVVEALYLQVLKAMDTDE